jgi:glycosyltransferase involved in cell wall biosynthesis
LVELLAHIRVLAAGVGGIVVYLVDDGGSVPVDPRDLPARTEHFDVVLARHPINLGQGAALETARQLAVAAGEHDSFVTMDSDHQHRPEDLEAFVKVIREGADVAFGNRFGAASNVPVGRRILLWAARVFEFALTLLWLSDAHNGYRAFSARAMKLVNIRQDRMAHATEIRQSVARHRGQLKIVEVPVSIRYTNETLAKGQTSLGAVSIVRDLLLRFLFGAQ